MIKLSFPAAYDDLNYNLVVINVALIPIAAGALRAYEEPEAWLTSADYELGYPALAELQIDLADMTSILPVIRGGSGVAAWPSFLAWLTAPTNQSIATGTFTKVLCNNELLDTNNNYDPTLARFTPTIAGIYLFTAYAVFPTFGADQKIMGVYIFKNGSRSLVVETSEISSGTGDQAVLTAGLITANGSTDYFELFTYHERGANAPIWSGGGSFSAIWVGPSISVDP